MALTKTQADGINLADTFAFTGTVSGAGGGATKGYAKGSNAAVIAHSQNVSSGTDNGTGDYTYALINAMSSADTAVVCTPYTNISRTGLNNPVRDTASVMAGMIYNPGIGGVADMAHTVIQSGDLA
jgi:hypothetical protein